MNYNMSRRGQQVFADLGDYAVNPEIAPPTAVGVKLPAIDSGKVWRMSVEDAKNGRRRLPPSGKRYSRTDPVLIGMAAREFRAGSGSRAVFTRPKQQELENQMQNGSVKASDTVLNAAAHELLAAYRTLVPVAPLRDRLEDMNVQDAYEVQTAQLEHHVAAGRVLAGRKVGLTSLAMQRQLGVDSPDFGFFFEDMVHHDEARIPAGGFIQPKVEPELGFVLKASLQGPGVTLEQAAAAIGAIYPAIEIIDSRIRDWDIKLVDTIADNASCGAIAVGSTAIGRRPG